MTREEMDALLKEHAKEFEDMSDAIWGFAETCFEEKQSMEIQRAYLEEKGFRTTAPAYNVVTAMMAEYGQGKPVIAILGEYDALHNMSQAADVTRYEPLEGSNKGHGCGHQLLGTAAVEAAFAVKEYMEANKLPGTVRYLGCPAEEGGAGKIYMLRSGAFDDVDVAISWHPGSVSGIWSNALSTAVGRFFFRGKAAHAAANPDQGRSALDAAELMNVGVQFLREHIEDGSRIHYAFHDAGGTRPNIVQSTAALNYCARAKDNDRVKDIFDRIVKIAQGAALMTETELLPVEITNAYSNIIPNSFLNELVMKEAGNAYPLPLTEEQKAYGRSFNQVIDGSNGDYNTEFRNIPRSSGSTDFGDVSWVVPSVAFTGACFAERTAGHSWALTAQGKSEAAHMGMHAAAKLMALCTIDLLEDPKLVTKAREAYEEALAGRTYSSLLPEDARPRILYT